MLNTVLKKPYYSDNQKSLQALKAFFFGLFVFLFLWFFRPFQIETATHHLWMISAAFGLITFSIMIVLNVLIPTFFRNYFNGESWTVGKEMFWSIVNISAIGFFNYLFFSFQWLDHFSLSSLLWFQLVTMAVGFFPISILILWRQNRENKKYEREAITLNEEITNHPVEPLENNSSPELIEIESQNANETLRMEINQLLYIKSADNYIEVFHQSAHGIKRSVLRNSLKTIDGQLVNNDDLFRCHKSYLVNLRHVNHVSGNAQGYKLHLQGAEELVPVSRQHNEMIRKRIAGRP